ncbi:hypothetical protein, partial [Propionicimonas sp.]|uniref:hypothetical protein n=1 Tax=Propionicimonas sp. TaxID=1955623 RepID=UPI002F41461E
MPLTIPGPAGNDVVLDPQPGAPIVVVGRNGSGKSALSSFLHTRLGQDVNRILSYRRLWLESSAASLTGQDRQMWDSNFQHWDARPESRWRDQNDQARLAALLYDLLHKQAFVDSEIARTVRSGASVDGLALDGPLELLNGILDAASLPISLFVDSEGSLMCRNASGTAYSAAEMSDGEKAALVLVSDVLIAK